MKTLRNHATIQPCGSTQSCGVGQRLLLGGYVALFAFILPFICWGALAEPGHPHQIPHFVFADPMRVKTRMIDEPSDAATGAAATVTHQHHLEQQGKQSRRAALAVVTPAGSAARCHLSPTDPPVSGRATPTLLLFSILLLLLATAPAFHQPDRLNFIRWVRPPLPKPYFCAVRLPPPRLSF